MTDQVAVHGIVSGRVQGVFYRASMAREATRLGVTGWVQNLMDGRVGFTAQGLKDSVDALVAWSREGPRGARVDDVAIAAVEPDSDHAAFVVR
ncbi:MAG: acylphosphatase [Pseudomonadales bacterium]